MTTALQTTETTLRLKFNKPQRHAYKRFKPRTTVVLPWGRGVGKSTFMLLVCLLLIIEWEHRWRPGMRHPGVRIIFLMPAMSQAKKGIIPIFVGMVRGDWRFLGGVINETTYRTTFPGGSYVQFVSQEQREFLRSIRADVVFADEGDDIEKDTFRDIVSPWFSEKFSLRMRMIGGTPTNGRNGLLYQLFSMARDGFPATFGRRATWRDVPDDVGSDYVAEQRAIAERNGVLPAFHREWECDFDSAEGIIYPSFDLDIHVRDRDPRVVWTDMLVGVDHGVAHAGVFLLIGVAGSGDDAECHILDEVYETGRDDVWWRNKALEWIADYPSAKWYADPSQPARIMTFRSAGANIEQANNHVADGLSEVSKRLVPWETMDGVKKARLYVAPRCVNTIHEFIHYRRRRDRAGNILEEPEKKQDHALDSARYALHTYFNGPPNGRNSAGWDARQ